MSNYTCRISVFIKKEDNVYYAYSSELVGCHAQGDTYAEAKEHIQQAVNLYLESFTEHEAISYLDTPRTEQSVPNTKFDFQLKLTAAQAEKLLVKTKFSIVGNKDNYRIYLKENARFILPLRGDKNLSQKMVQEVLNLVEA